MAFPISTNRLVDVKLFMHKSLDPIYGSNEVEAMFSIALEFYFNLTKQKAIVDPSYSFTESQLLILVRFQKRLLKQEPLQYILGETEFYDLKIKVTKDVLIPRPETEELVRWILQENKNTKINILDIGTGSGCIAIALAKNLSNAKITALDVSYAALQIAIFNAKQNEVIIEPICADINNDTSVNLKIDLIVSNPPYVLMKEKKQMNSNVVDYEPHLALFVDDQDPLLFYRTIGYFAQKNLVQGGKLYFEINEAYGDDVVSLLLTQGFKSIEKKMDLNNKWRMVRCIK